MELKEVVSSNIKAIGFEDASLRLGVVFKKSPNKLYIFHPVDSKTHEKLMKAESHGKFFQANIKDNKRYSVHTEDIDNGIITASAVKRGIKPGKVGV